MKRLLVLTRLSKLTILIALVMLLCSCGGADLDEISPALTFDGVSVNGIPSAATTTPTRALSGTVEPGATVEVTQGTTVTTATVTGDIWTAEVSLQPGVNLLTVGAADARGNQNLFSLSLTYDAVSIETYTTPISVDNLTISGLVDGVNYTSPLEVTVTPADTGITPFTVQADVVGDNWSVPLAGLATGANEVKLSNVIAGVVEPVEAVVTITVDAAAPVVTIDPPASPVSTASTVIVPSQTVTGGSDPAATSLAILPLPVDGDPVVDAGTGNWSALIDSLAVGKNPVTATVTLASGATATARTLLLVEPTPPLVVSTSPVKNAVGVAVTSAVTVQFHADMDANSITTGTFTLDAGGVLVPATVVYEAATRTASLTPDADLAATTLYTVTLTTGITDDSVAKNPLSQPLSWNFTTL
ncbi:MAG TPA: Ig-like domain-containing protein [Geothermobacteraceae bacterium]|nr:Ig-like domain-containing protein [Geothermobacteraceae bacterium]